MKTPRHKSLRFITPPSKNDVKTPNVNSSWNNKNFCFSLQGLELNDDIASGIIVSNRSLVLQRVTKKAAGLFACQATNAEGHSTSNQLQLNVKCKPKFLEIFFSSLCKTWKSLTQKVFFCIHKDQRNFCIQLLKNFFKDKPSFSVARKFIAQLKTLIFFVPLHLANKF